jgi:PadR family transcriptional regulator, regulatory protein PadR
MKGVLISMVFQIGSALLDACVLSALEEEPLYGYALTQKVKSVVDISESTLYPVLRRLTKDGLLSTYDQPFNGRNRRYYVLTDYGKSQLIFLRNEWISYKERLDGILINKEAKILSSSMDSDFASQNKEAKILSSSMDSDFASQNKEDLG